MEKEILEELEDALSEIENGGRFAVIKGKNGVRLGISERTSLIIMNAIANYIQPEGGNDGK